MQYSRGQNPNSIKALKEKGRHEGRPKAEVVYGEPKKRRTLSVTQSGWEQSLAKIKQMGYGSVSEFLEEWGREDSAIA